MRAATMNKSLVVLRNEDGDPVVAGICLGNDGCAEHGAVPKFVSGLLGLGMDTKLGIRRHTNSRHAPQHAMVINDGEDAYFEISRHVPDIIENLREIIPQDKTTTTENATTFSTFPAYSAFPKRMGTDSNFFRFLKREVRLDTKEGSRNVRRPPRNRAERELAVQQGAGLHTDWDDQNGFAIYVRGSEFVQALLNLVKAYEGGSLVICRSSDLPAGRETVRHSGLLILDAQQVPQPIKDAMLSRDETKRDLKSATDESGILDRLTKGGLRWFALEPNWVTDRDGCHDLPELQGEDRLCFFLNPHDQKRYRHGWVSVSDLDDWISGKGFVVDGSKADGHFSGMLARLRERVDPGGVAIANQALAESGIADAMRANDVGYFDLVPHVVDGQLMVWWNPKDQANMKMGWFTPDELLQAARNEGPAMYTAVENEGNKVPGSPRLERSKTDALEARAMMIGVSARM